MGSSGACRLATISKYIKMGSVMLKSKARVLSKALVKDGNASSYEKTTHSQQ